ncbi:hypothetical protein [Compostibacter hankyongensis]|uniref:HEAT repeat domain-containing protein n=1 Tax=Compostibacter hankyongensis TaxID=1007089 RepID=A0ABP8FZX7_9BACT
MKKLSEDKRKLIEMGGFYRKEWNPLLKKEVEVFVPNYIDDSIMKRENEMKKRLQDAKKENEKLYQELRDNNYITPDSMEWSEYISKYRPFDKQYIQIVLKWLPSLNNKDVALGLLHYPKHKYDGKILTETFELGKDREYRWRICELIDFVLPINIDEWIVNAFLNPEYGNTTEMLGLAISKLFPYPKASDFLCRGFFLHPMHASKALGEIGKDKELSFLNQHKEMVDKYTQKEITKSIQKINKRLEQKNPK